MITKGMDGTTVNQSSEERTWGCVCIRRVTFTATRLTEETGKEMLMQAKTIDLGASFRNPRVAYSFVFTDLYPCVSQEHETLIGKQMKLVERWDASVHLMQR